MSEIHRRHKEVAHHTSYAAGCVFCDCVQSLHELAQAGPDDLPLGAALIDFVVDMAALPPAA